MTLTLNLTPTLTLAPTKKQARDRVLLFMSRPCWGWLAFLHLLWIIGDGAFFVFLVLNWQVDQNKGMRGAWHEAWRVAHDVRDGVRHGVAACVVHGV